MAFGIQEKWCWCFYNVLNFIARGKFDIFGHWLQGFSALKRFIKYLYRILIMHKHVFCNKFGGYDLKLMFQNFWGYGLIKHATQWIFMVNFKLIGLDQVSKWGLTI